MEKGSIVMLLAASFLAIVYIASGTIGRAVYDHALNELSRDCNNNPIDDGVMRAGAGASIWEDGAGCGRLYSVRCIGPIFGTDKPCTGKTLTVKIITEHSWPQDMSLSRAAWFTITDGSLSNQMFKIEYQSLE